MHDQLLIHSNNKGAIPEYSTLILNTEILIAILVLNTGRGPIITIFLHVFQLFVRFFLCRSEHAFK
jgi:hypothetical protein